MQALDVAASPRDPVAYQWLLKFLPASVVVNTFATFFTFFISIGGYGPARRFWQSFEIFIALAWLFFLIALTLSIIVSRGPIVVVNVHRIANTSLGSNDSDVSKRPYC